MQAIALILISLSISITTFAGPLDSFKFKGESADQYADNESFLCIQDGVIKSAGKIRRCLNAYGKYVLRDGGRVAKAFFNTDPETSEGALNDYARRYNIDPAQHTPLSDFRIKVPAKSDVALFGGGQCFSYAGVSKANRKQFILTMKKQIEVAAEFLSHHHVNSAGARNSWFFHLSQIEICSKKSFAGRPFAYSMHKLHIGLSRKMVYGKHRAYSVGEIADAWESENVVRRVDKNLWTSFYTAIPLIGKKIRAFHVYRQSGKEGVIMDLVAEKWGLMNPTGLLRSGLIPDLMGGISRLLKGKGVLSSLNNRILTTSNVEVQEIEAKAIKAELLRVSDSGPGLAKEKLQIAKLSSNDSRDVNTLKEIYEAYLRILGDRYTIIEIFEAGIGESSFKSNPLYDPHATQTFRFNDRRGTTIIGAGVFNDKQVDVLKNFLPPGSLSVDRFSKRAYKAKEATRVTAEKKGYILVTNDEELAAKAAKVDDKFFESLKCETNDDSQICKIKALSLKITEDSMMYTDGDMTLIRYVPGMSYEINTDRMFTFLGATLNLIDDVSVLDGLKMPEINKGIVQRYSLAKAAESGSLVKVNLD